MPTDPDHRDLERIRLTRAEPARPAAGPGPVGAPAFVGRVVTATPISPGYFFLVHPVIVTGTETEGGAGILNVDTSVTIPVYFVGPGTPAAGEDLVCRLVGYRWVAERTGGGPPPHTVPMPGCSCSPVPDTLDLVNTTPGCNGSSPEYFPNATIAWTPTPAGYAALSLGSSCFLSTTSFLDNTGDNYRYYLSCTSSIFSLSRVYLTNSIFGSPFLDPGRYTWNLGAAGNSCHPFALTSGATYSGGGSCTLHLTDGT